MSEEAVDDWRQLKAHLESLRRAGLADLPVGQWVAPPVVARTPAGGEPRQVVPIMPPPRVEPPPALKPPEAPAAVAAAAAKPTYQRPPASPSPPPRPAPVSVAAMFDQSRIPYETPVTPLAERAGLLQVIADEVAACTRCPHLAATRTQTVFQSGTPTARLMFVGEAPGADEDEQGEPFVGRAGQLVTNMVTAGMGLSRSEVYIANVLKCRPPENRTPIQTEIDNCLGYLDRQIEIVRPEFICLLGKTAVAALLRSALPMKSLRGRWFRYRDIPTMVTYHPAYLLRNPPAKKDTWEDLKMLMKEMGLTPPPSLSSKPGTAEA